MNHDILAGLYYSSVYPLVALSGILLIQSQVVSFNQFGSRIKYSCLRIYGELVCKGFSRSFYNLWGLHCTC